jgi:integrase
MARWDAPRGTWRLTWEVSRKGEPRRRASRSFAAPHNERGRKLAEREEARLAGDAAAARAAAWAGADDGSTFGAFAAGWIARGTDWKPRTVRTHTDVLRDHVLPTLGAKRLRDITPVDIENMFAAWADLPGRTTEHISPATRARWVRIVRTIFADAIRLGALDRDPMVRVRRVSGKAPEKAIPSPTEVTEIIEAARTPAMRLYFQIAAGTGARSDSVRNLRWRDVDLDDGTLFFGITKEDKPYVVAIDDRLVAELRAARHRARETAMAAGTPGGFADRYVFSDDAHGRKPFTAGAASHAFRAVRTDLGLNPGITLHSLRHFHATRLLSASVPARDVADRLGCTENNVIRTYSHRVKSGNDRRSAQIIADLLAGAAM